MKIPHQTAKHWLGGLCAAQPRLTSGLIVFGLMLVGSSLCKVQAGVLPGAYMSLQTQTQAATYGYGVAGQTILGSTGTINVSANGSRSSSASATINMNMVNGTIPETSLTAIDNYTGSGGGYYAYTEATATLIYAVMINGPAGQNATLDFSLSGSTGGAYGAGNALYGFNIEEISPGATVSISNSGVPSVSGGSTTDLYNNGYFNQLTSASNTPIILGTSYANVKLSAASGTVFLLELQVDAASDPTQYWYPGPFPPNGYISATIDPTLSIDPTTTNADAFSLSYSAGIDTVPEPSTWALLAGGCASLLALRRRQS